MFLAFAILLLSPVLFVVTLIALILILPKPYNTKIAARFSPIMFSFPAKHRQAKTNPQKEFGIEYDDVYLPGARKGLKIHGFFIPSLSSGKAPCVVMIHGWTQTTDYLLSLVPTFRKLGYSCLLIEGRSHGKSSTDGIATMLKFSEDVQAAVTFLCNERTAQVDSSRIGVVGFSLGSAAALHATSFDTRIQFCVALGGFARIRKLWMFDFTRRGMPKFLAKLCVELTAIGFGFDLEEVQPETRLAFIEKSTKVLVVHGGLDGGVPFDHALLLQSKAKEVGLNFELLAIPSAKHLNLFTYPEVMSKLEHFAATAFAPTPAAVQGSKFTAGVQQEVSAN